MGVACLKFRGENFRGYTCKIAKFVKVFSLESFPLYGNIPSGKMTICGHSPLALAYLLISLTALVREPCSSLSTNIARKVFPINPACINGGKEYISEKLFAELMQENSTAYVNYYNII